MDSSGTFAYRNTGSMIFDLLIHKIKSMTGTVSDPFILDFRSHVLYDRSVLPDYEFIEKIRSGLLRSTSLVSPADFGAGTRRRKQDRNLGQITRIASVNERYGRLLYRLACHYKPSRIIELGTAAGISTLYLALGNPKAKVITVEGNPRLAELTTRNFKDLDLNNVTVIRSTFDDILPDLTKGLSPDSLIYIDGNHTTDATERYFNAFTRHAGMKPILVLHDINWSKEMSMAWKKIRQNIPDGTIIDLFFMGIYFPHSSPRLQYFQMNY
jgi:predicted O-methyltransferase YrrM